MALNFGQTLFGQKNYIESMGGNRVEIDELGNLNISGNTLVAFDGAQEVTFGSAQEVYLDSAQNVYAVQSGAYVVTGEVTFPSAQSVQFDAAQDVNASIAGTVSVQFGSAQSVQFDSAQDVNITGTPSVDITGENIYAIQSGAWVVTGTVSFPSAQSVQFDSAQDINIAGIEVTTGQMDVNISGSAVTIDVFTTGTNIEQHLLHISGTSIQQSWSNACKSFIFFNASGATVHFNEDAAATASHFPILPKQTFAIDIASQDTRFICPDWSAAAGSGATVYMIGMY